MTTSRDPLISPFGRRIFLKLGECALPDLRISERRNEGRYTELSLPAISIRLKTLRQSLAKSLKG
jgi:hypothetical protein